jgi:hypothetical protein
MSSTRQPVSSQGPPSKRDNRDNQYGSSSSRAERTSERSDRSGAAHVSSPSPRCNSNDPQQPIHSNHTARSRISSHSSTGLHQATSRISHTMESTKDRRKSGQRYLRSSRERLQRGRSCICSVQHRHVVSYPSRLE